jgi:hypothetical protein
MAITPIHNVWSPKRLRASVTEGFRAPARAFRQVPMAITPIQNVWSPKRLRASVTERRSRAPARAFREVPTAITPIQNVWFDDAATLAMGEAFDRACKSLRNLGSAVPEIIAYLIIQAAKSGERDPARLYGQALKAFHIEDMSMPVVSVGSDLPVPAYASVTQAA